ncbi:transcription factor vib-1 [Podospora aff. communis PSN243]|uniref:Transcription factor vib-1 n=1 Tax=Podospora aff. communis PSN243 TaxID=3040156 RepID=A0AAV9GVE8_9PEZI|nr:transcription factor vib-1 [Podospora aff. communis PSN243]
MSTTATYAVTMAELRGEPTPHGSIWSNYGNPAVHQMPGPRGYGNPSDLPPPVRPRSRHAMDYPPPHPSAGPGPYGHPQQHHPGAREEDGSGYDRYPHPSLMNIPSINSLKRSYSQVDQGNGAPYTEMVQDLRDDYKPNSHDQKLLSFKKVGDKHTIVDNKGRIHEMEIDAQLHGMFFLSEFPAGAGPEGGGPPGGPLNAELTCYRRNLFQISGSLCFPQIPLSVLTPETGETSLIKNMEVSISAIESVDGHPVRLIVIPWKTPPPNSPEVNQAPDQEPPPLPLIPWSEDEEENGGDHYAIYPIGWRRLQFRIATANNGRRKELQQHFVLHLKLHGTLANGQKIVLSELTTAPIVVRGRSPRNFQARKEIPLLGSSAGSRGQTLVETGHGIVAQAVVLNKPPYDSRPRVSSMEVPRSAFTFTAPKQMPQSPMQMRSNSYPTTWPPQSQVSLPHSASSYPPSDPYGQQQQQPQPKMAPTFTAEPADLAGGQTSMPSVQLSLVSSDSHGHPQQPPPPIRTQFATYNPTSAAPTHLGSLSATTDNSLNVPRYVDSNPRPSKSPRHASHNSAGSLSADTTSGEYRYGPSPYVPASADLSPQSAAAPQSATYPPPSQSTGQDGGHHTPVSSAPQSATGQGPARDYFPPSQSWTTTAGEAQSATAYGGSAGAGDNGSRPYAFPTQQQSGGVKNEGAHAGYGQVPQAHHYAWNAT